MIASWAASVAVVALGLAIRMAALAIMSAHWLSIIQVKVGQDLQGRLLATNLMLALATQPIGFLAAEIPTDLDAIQAQADSVMAAAR